MIYIYGLVESGKKVGQIRYIGITTDPDQRLYQHRTAKEDTDKGRWIADLRESGKNVDMVLLDSAATRDEAHIKENAWILFARSRGWHVTNGTTPGEHRALLQSEIASIEDVVAMVSKLMDENAAIKANMLNELDLERQRHIEQQRLLDAHFNKRYQFAIGAILTAAAVAMVVWLFSGYSYQNAMQRLGVVEATSLLIGMIIAYPSIALALWVILKDVPLYKPRALSAEWVESLNTQQSISYNAIKRALWHTAGMAAILGAIALFGG
jgi:predicted GIY-YIG superfamily endonuclease